MEKIDIDEIALKLNYLKETKNQIKAALIGKGIEVKDTDTFRSYANKLNNMSTKAKIPAIATFNFEGTVYWDDKQQTNVYVPIITPENVSILEDIDTSELLTHERFLFCSTITSCPAIDTSSSLNFTQMFGNCTALVTAPTLDSTNVKQMAGMFEGCLSLVNVPVYDTSNILNDGTRFEPHGMAMMFHECENLSNQSLDNILQMCINATQYVADQYYGKTLKALGLTQEQAEICETLNHFSAFENAGWTTGFETQQM